MQIPLFSTAPRLRAGLLLAALAGCAAAPRPTALTGIELVGEVGANTNSATQLDIVFVYDPNVVALLPAKGPDWFDQKDALQKALASAITVLEFGVPPATLVRAALPKGYEKAVAVYSYANYLSAPGQPKCNLTPFKSMVIWLTPDTVVCSGK
jgi:type VI secretion system protein